jgi:glycosyltransferase involved in cell wall biosynthesis
MVDIRPAPHILNASGEHPFRFIYFGRPSPQKRFELIEDIAAFFEEHEVHAEIHVFGYSNLEPAAGIVNRGLTNDPISEMRSADCLLMASAYEGFPTVLVEAAITGTPVLTMNFETGLTDFIKDFGPVAVAQTDAELLRAAREIVREGSRLLPRGQYNLGHVKSEISLKRWVTCLLD